MSSYIKSIAQILNDTESILKFLKNANLYYAHIRPNSADDPEPLNDHILLVQDKFKLLSEIHKIDSIVSLMIVNLFDENKILFDLNVADFIKKVWVNTVVFHDFGKVNENFQAHPEKMNNPNFKGKENTNSPISTHHSSLGAYLYITKHLEELTGIESKYKNLLSACVIYFSYSIFKHHGKYLGDNVNLKIQFSPLESEFMETYLKIYQFELSEKSILVVKKIADVFYANKYFNKYLSSFSLYSLVRLSFSMLTASDFLASGEYMTGLEVKPDEFGVLIRDRIDKIYDFVTKNEWLNEREGKRNFNQTTFQKALSEYYFQNPTERTNANLNVLRQEMGVEVLQTVRAKASKNLFYIEAPTGGGKTNLSFLATIELLKLNPELNKVFYVFPFTTLVTQTQKSLIETFGLSEDEVITLSSKSGFKEKITIEKEDDEYGKDKKFFLDNLFCFFPFCLLTHVKFFNILKTNEKEENYLLHRLANSVVVLDELQAYSPDVWDKVIYFIKNYAHFYNIKFIVMSATLPKLGNLKIKGLKEDDFVYLIDNAKERYFKNPNFANRVSFNSDLLKEKNLKLEDLASMLISKSKEYAEKDFGKAKPKNSVYTIVEFIFKKSATTFYELIQNGETFFDEVFVLSGTILEHRRKCIINYLKNEENRKKKILLITTQVVEAGVDIDMDLGFKDKSLIDSDEQLAGRINRNVNKGDCVLYLFNYNREKVIYGKDKRYSETQLLSKEEYFEILTTKNFDKIYNRVLSGIEAWNRKEGAIGFEEYERNIKQLRFQSTHFDFNLINKDFENLTVFIPMAIPVQVEGTTSGSFDRVFSINEVAFLVKRGIGPNLENKIEGKKVFDLYLELLETKGGDITSNKIGSKVMQGIISKFIIQMLGTDKIKGKLVEFQDVEKSNKGYIYLERWNVGENPLYSEYSCINDTAFADTETQFL